MNGLDCRVNIYSEYAHEDDIIGGPELTGTLMYEYVGARLEDVPSEMLPLVQGIVTNQGVYATLHPGNLSISNNYILVVTWPPSHVLFNVPLRVKQTTHSSAHGSAQHIELLLDRFDESHQIP